MNYEEMSDFEINKAVLLIQDIDGDIESVTQRQSRIKCISNQALVKIKEFDDVEKFNPCNDPSDAWPIIVENKFSITSWGNRNDFWMVSNCSSWDADNPTSINVVDKNPLRAAMICFLKVKDAE